MGSWSVETVTGHPCDVFQPQQPNELGFVVLYLHGVHQQPLADSPPFMELFERHSLPVIAPRTRRSWWTDKVCHEFDARFSAERYLLDHILPFIQQRFAPDAARIGLLGTSMGGQGALRLAYKYPDRFPVVAAISPAIDYQCRFDEGDETITQMYEDKEAVRQDTATLHVHPLNWPRHQFFCCDPADVRWWDSADRLRMKLYSLGIPHQCDLTTSGGGHGFDYYNLMAKRAVEFLTESLERERRRIV